MTSRTPREADESPPHDTGDTPRPATPTPGGTRKHGADAGEKGEDESKGDSVPDGKFPQQ